MGQALTEWSLDLEVVVLVVSVKYPILLGGLLSECLLPKDLVRQVQKRSSDH